MTDPLSGAFASTTPHTQVRFVVLEQVALGGMGIVYKVHDRVVDRVVAMKRARSDIPGAEERLREEARLLARLDHPGVLSVLEAGDDPLGFRLLTPWLEGPDATEVLGDPELGPRALRDIAEALAHAHDRGIVHRDLKPSNILLHDGRAVLLDWGLARPIGHDPERTLQTRTGLGLGTPGFMAPEQALGGTIDARTDVWAFGALIVQHLLGDVSTLTERALGDHPLDLPHGPLAALARRCLRTAPTDRPADGRALVAALEPLVSTPRTARWRPLALATSLGLLGGVLAATLTPSSRSKPLEGGEAAMTELAWRSLRAGRTLDAATWIAPLAERTSPSLAGLRMALPPLDSGTPIAPLDACDFVELSRDGKRLACVLQNDITWMDASSGEPLWRRTFRELQAIRSYGDRLLFVADDVLQVIGDDDMLDPLGQAAGAQYMAVNEAHVIVHTGTHAGHQAPSGPIAITKPIDLRTPPDWTGSGWLAAGFRELYFLAPEDLSVTHRTEAFAHQDLFGHLLVPEGIATLGMRGELSLVSREGDLLRQIDLASGLLNTFAMSEDHIATSSPSHGVLLWDRRTGGLIQQVRSKPARSLAFDGSTLLVADETLTHHPIHTSAWTWTHPSLSAMDVGDSLWVASADAVDRLDEDRTSFPLSGEGVVKSVLETPTGFLVGGAFRGLYGREGPVDIEMPRRTLRRSLQMADDTLLLLPFSAGPLVIRGKHFHPELQQFGEEFVTAHRTTSGDRAVLVARDGGLWNLTLDPEGPRLERYAEEPETARVLPTDAGDLHIDARGGQRDGERLWTSRRTVTAADHRGSRCALGTLEGIVELRDCHTGELEAELFAHLERVADVVLTDDALFTASWDEHVRRFSLP